MIQGFQNQGTQDIFNGRPTKAARKLCPQPLWNTAFRKLDQLDSVKFLDELRIPPGNRLEALKGDRQQQHNLCINDRYRLCFVWHENGPHNVEIVDYH